MSTASNRSRRELEESQWEARQRRRKLLTIGVWATAGLLFVALLVYLVAKEAVPADLPGEAIPILPAGHVNPGTPHDPYNSDPPTSGQHYPTPAETGFYEEALADEYLVHNLEHGHVIIWYNCSNVSEADCGTLKTQIRDVMGRAGVSQVTGTSKMSAVPRPSMESLLAVTAWGRLYTADEFDRNTILAFVRAFRDHAPENGAP